MDEIRLTDEEIFDAQGASARVDDNARAINLASIKKVVEWSDEICHEHRPFDQRKTDCYECWVALKKSFDEAL